MTINQTSYNNTLNTGTQTQGSDKPAQCRYRQKPISAQKGKRLQEEASYRGYISTAWGKP